MKDDKMVLIAYHMFGSNTGAYIGWLVKKLKIAANKTEYKDAQLVILPADAVNPQASIYFESFFSPDG
jgi:hypothetical protein